MRNKKNNYLFLSALLAILLGACDKTNSHSPSTPNVIIIYMDDLGYGDLGAYGATSLKTPNFDKIANEGVRFTDGHATSSTCTPSRYGLLTGVYPWKKKGVQILPGSAALLIDTAQLTLPKVFKEKGYNTGIVGKWHLGLGNGNIDWNEHISPCPNDIGFDYSYIMAATQDRVPTVYIENGKVDNLNPNDPIEVSYKHNFEGEPTGRKNPEMLTMMYDHGHDHSIVNGISRIGYMKGGKSALWSDVDMADHFLTKAQDFIKGNKEKPFFLYYAMHQPHVPRTPNPRFVGKSGMGPRGDVIVEADWCVGELLNTLESEGILDNTLIIFSSDNGPVLNDGYKDEAVEKVGNHKQTGILRGGKYSMFEAGTRVPFMAYWKGKIRPTVSDALICQIDILSSMAQLIGSDVSTDDSQALLEVLMGNSQEGRSNLIMEASHKTVLRNGNWVLIPPYKGAFLARGVNIEIGCDSTWQLYNLKDDISQHKNMAETNPEKLKEMQETYKQLLVE
ncbi:MAG: sulfatase family protein [Bacteroidales bacterium]